MWLLPAWWARRPWQFARARGGPLPAIALAGTPAVETTRHYAAPAAPEGKCPQGSNFALAEHGAIATGGINPAELIDGNCTVYGHGTGFASTTWNVQPPQFFTVTLKDLVTVDCVRILLWDRDEERYYRYKLEISADGNGVAWLLVADHTAPTEQCRSWQVVRFKPQPVKRIRLTGTFNSANSGFHVVELQASLGLPAGTPPPKPPEVLEF